MLTSVLSILAAVVLAAAAAGLGSAALPWFRLRREDWLPAMAAGLGLGGLIVAALGLAGLYRPAPAWAAAAAGLSALRSRSAGMRMLRACAGEWAALVRGGGTGWTGPALGWLLAGSFALSLPPVFLHDTLAYHLSLPQQWILSGWMHRVPSLAVSALPAGAASEYGWAFLLGGGPVAWGGWRGPVVVSWLHLPLAAAALARVVGACGGGPAARTGAAAAWVSLPAVLIAGGNPLADLQGTLSVLLAAWLALRGRAAGTGLMAGLAYAAKLNAGGLALPAAAVLAWRARGGPFRRLGTVAAFGAVALAAAAPWMARAWLEAGSPLAPAWPRTELMERREVWLATWRRSPPGIGAALADPARIAAGGDGPYARELSQAGGSLAGLYLAPLCWLPGGGAPARWIAGWMAGGWLAGHLAGWTVRYLLPCAALGCAVWMLALPGRRPSSPWRLAALLVLSLPRLGDATDMAGRWWRAGCRDAPALEAIRGQWPHRAAGWVRNALPRDARLAWVFEPQIFYAGRRAAWSLADDRAYLEAVVEETFGLAGALRRLRRDGITHLLVGGYAPVPDLDVRQFPPPRASATFDALGRACRAVYADPLAPYVVLEVPRGSW